MSTNVVSTFCQKEQAEVTLGGSIGERMMRVNWICRNLKLVTNVFLRWHRLTFKFEIDW